MHLAGTDISVRIKKTLPNGLTVTHLESPHAVSVALGLFVRMGSRYENSEYSGYTHFTEHMLFKGTEKRSAKKIAEEIERAGGIINAATSREYTYYYIIIIKEKLELGLELLSDMIFNSVFAESEVLLEKEVIFEEWKRTRDDPEEFLSDLYYNNLFQGHPLGTDILGNETTIKSVTRDKLFSFYKHNYTPSNMLLSVSGNCSPGEIEALALKWFNFGNGTSPKHDVSVYPKKYFTKNHHNKDLEQISFVLGGEGDARSFRGGIVKGLISLMLGAGMSSRLFQKIREELALCYNINSHISSYRDTGFTSIYCSTSPEKFEKCISEIIKIIQDINKNGFSREEFDNAKTNMLGQNALAYEITENKMQFAALQELYFNDFFSYHRQMEEISSVDFDEVMQAFYKIFKIPSLHLSSIGKIQDKKFSEISVDL